VILFIYFLFLQLVVPQGTAEPRLGITVIKVSLTSPFLCNKRHVIVSEKANNLSKITSKLMLTRKQRQRIRNSLLTLHVTSRDYTICYILNTTPCARRDNQTPPATCVAFDVKRSGLSVTAVLLTRLYSHLPLSNSRSEPQNTNAII
jgi:hypothetical protein